MPQQCTQLILFHATSDTLPKTSTLSFCFIFRMQTWHNEEEEYELELPGSDMDHRLILPQLFGVDTPLTISCTQQGMTTIHSNHSPEMSYAQNLNISGVCLSTNLQHLCSSFSAASFVSSRGIFSWRTRRVPWGKRGEIFQISVPKMNHLPTCKYPWKQTIPSSEVW